MSNHATIFIIYNVYCRCTRRMEEPGGGRERGKQAPPAPLSSLHNICIHHLASLITSCLLILLPLWVCSTRDIGSSLMKGTINLELSVLLSRLESRLKLFVEIFLQFLLRTTGCVTLVEGRSGIAVWKQIRSMD